MLKQRDFYHVSLKAILKNKDSKVLILKARQSGTFSGFYDLPGGRIDEDEFSKSLPEILRREISEESGITDITVSAVPVATGRHCIKKEHSKTEKDIHVFYVFFEVQLKSGDVSISHEHENHAWINLNDIILEEYFTSGILEGMKMYLKKA
jgi:8-oxo-dGTP pyrophosphatase MutT (NUDIX family)